MKKRLIEGEGVKKWGFTVNELKNICVYYINIKGVIKDSIKV